MESSEVVRAICGFNCETGREWLNRCGYSVVVMAMNLASRDGEEWGSRRLSSAEFFLCGFLM